MVFTPVTRRGTFSSSATDARVPDESFLTHPGAWQQLDTLIRGARITSAKIHTLTDQAKLHRRGKWNRIVPPSADLKLFNKRGSKRALLGQLRENKGHQAEWKQKAKLNHTSRNQRCKAPWKWHDKLEKDRGRSWKQDLRVCYSSRICSSLRGEQDERPKLPGFGCSWSGKLQHGGKELIFICSLLYNCSTLVQQAGFEAVCRRRGWQATVWRW